MWSSEQVPVWFQRAESGLIAVLLVVVFTDLGFAWWWLAGLFLVFDVSMIGYVHTPQLGAWTYNVVHSYLAPAAVGLVAVAADSRGAAFLALVWAFHIAVDRLLGYGLKFCDRFSHTHLGDVGGAASAGTLETRGGSRG